MKKQNKKKFWAWFSLSIVLLIAAGLVGNVLVRSAIQKKISSSLKQFEPYIHSDFASIHVNLFEASANIDSLALSYQPDVKDPHRHAACFTSASITGINFFKLMSAKNFAAGTLQL